MFRGLIAICGQASPRLGNRDIATVTGDGLVQAVKSGTVLIQTTHESECEVFSLKSLQAERVRR